MVSIYFYQLISILSLIASLYFNNSPIPNPEPNFDKELLGEWTYTLPVCSNKGEIEANFTLYIRKDYVAAGGNLLECNGCSKESQITSNKIIFPNKHSSAICTLLECNDQYKFCGDENTLIHIFQDMEYTVKGDKLVLKRDNQTLELKRKA